MKALLFLVATALLVVGVSGGRARALSGRQQPAAASTQRPVDRRPENPHQESNDRYAQRIAESIAGHENEPAAKVFKNIQLDWLENVPAGRFLLIMNAGYSRALGVECTHCHDEQDFSSDDKRPKRAAREMAVMHHTINQELAKMQHLESDPGERFINCGTCHQGRVNPNR